MKINQDAEVFQQAHQALVDEHKIYLNPRALTTVLETALDGRVTEEKANERVQAGKRQLRQKHADLEDAVLALTVARDFVTRVRAWEGPESKRDECLEMLDRAITYFKP